VEFEATGVPRLASQLHLLRPEVIMQLTVYVVIWSCLAVVVLALALVRFVVALHEDDNIHISVAQESLISGQKAIFGKLDAIDRWGKTLTVLALVSGLALAALYLKQVL
jgi:hypothetical protein